VGHCVPVATHRPVCVALLMPAGNRLNVGLELRPAFESKAWAFLNLDRKKHQPFLAAAKRCLRAIAAATCAAVRRVLVGCTATLITVLRARVTACGLGSTRPLCAPIIKKSRPPTLSSSGRRSLTSYNRPEDTVPPNALPPPKTAPKSELSHPVFPLPPVPPPAPPPMESNILAASACAAMRRKVSTKFPSSPFRPSLNG